MALLGKKKTATQNNDVESAALEGARKIYNEGMASIKDLISPSAMEINLEHMMVGEMFCRSLYVYGYPRFIETNWLSPLINFPVTMDMSMFIFPEDTERIVKLLRNKIGQMNSVVTIDTQKGRPTDPKLKAALEDAEELREHLGTGQEKFFQFGIYFTVYAEKMEDLDKLTKQIETMLGSNLIMSKRSILRMEQAFNTTVPYCTDELVVTRNMNTGPLSTTFPFTSSNLSDDDGILYGLNRHNNSLIIFDRFNLPNANSCVFSTSGGGKSYAVKLEILRYLMRGVDVVVVDPENEYKPLCDAVGGTYMDVSMSSARRINPFDLPLPLKDQPEAPGDLLRQAVADLKGLMRIMLTTVTDKEFALLEKGILDTYRLKGIDFETKDPGTILPPTMMDFYDVISEMEGGGNIAIKLEPFVKGIYAGLFNQPTNVDLKSGLVVFSIRDLDEALRPIATYIVLSYIWNKVRSSLKRRLLVIDEAWKLMQYEDSARFLFGLVKRARKYYLGVTTITQDVEDFLRSENGRAIVTNSAMQLLLRQSSAAMNQLAEIFNLTEAEKFYLLNSKPGEGIFAAGSRRVAAQVIASYGEDKIITTNPEQILKMRAGGAREEIFE